MHTEIQVRGSFTAHGIKALTKIAAESVEEFFLGLPVITHVKLVVHSVGRANVRECLIKIRPALTKLGHVPVGVPVAVHTEGGQGLMCLLTIPGMSDEAAHELVEKGPYNRKRRVENVVPEAVPAHKLAERVQLGVSYEPVHDAPTQEPPAAVVEVPVLPPAPVEVAPVPQPQPVVRLSPYEKLVAAGESEENISRLRVTMASIVYRHMGEGEMPNTLQVPVTGITEAILDHMELPRNSANTYRGTIANFYSTRISLFAMKWENSLDPDAIYTDWVIDCVLVADFVGGLSNLAALSRLREEEVSVRQETQRAIEENPPPTAVEVQEVVATGFFADAGLIDLAAKTLEGKRLAQATLDAALQNSAQLAADVARLEEQLVAAQAAHQASLSLVTEAELEIEKYVLPEQTKEAVRKARERLNKLAEDLGL